MIVRRLEQLGGLAGGKRQRQAAAAAGGRSAQAGGQHRCFKSHITADKPAGLAAGEGPAASRPSAGLRDRELHAGPPVPLQDLLCNVQKVMLQRRSRLQALQGCMIRHVALALWSIFHRA